MTAIRNLRRQAGLSIERFARALGVATRTVYRWEATEAPRVAELAAMHLISEAKRRAEDKPGNI
jgi:DNA-binding transcriptional regulator YiaG